MKLRRTMNWSILAAALSTTFALASGCTEEQTSAVLAGVQVAADELGQEDEVSFRDWLSSELDD
jgi:hypothetical protein